MSAPGTEPVCPRTDLPQAWCAHCRGHDQPPTATVAGELGQPFMARYDGRCALCDGPIRTGDITARLAPDDGDGYACQDCLP